MQKRKKVEGYTAVIFTPEQKQKLIELAKSQSRCLSHQIIWELRHVFKENENESGLLHGKPRLKRRGRENE